MFLIDLFFKIDLFLLLKWPILLCQYLYNNIRISNIKCFGTCPLSLSGFVGSYVLSLLSTFLLAGPFLSIRLTFWHISFYCLFEWWVKIRYFLNHWFVSDIVRLLQSILPWIKKHSWVNLCYGSFSSKDCSNDPSKAT